MASRSRDILEQITQLKNALDGFSFDELTISEAKALKHSFETFRINLEDSVWGNPLESVKNQLNLNGDSEFISNSKNKSLANPKKEISGISRIKDFIKSLTNSGISANEKIQLKAIQDFINTSFGPIKQEQDHPLNADLQRENPFIEKATFNPVQIIEQVKFICQTLITSDQLSFKINIDRAVPENLEGNGAQFYDLLMKLLGSRISELNIGNLEVKIYPKQIKNELNLNIELIEQNLEFSSSTNATGREKATISLIELSQLVDKLGGKFWLGNAFGNQSSIHLQIPIKAKSKDVKAKPLAGKVIVVLNNNSNHIKRISGYLMEWGSKVLLNYNSLQTFQMLDKQKVDLIIMPAQMDGIDAFQACMRIRNSASVVIQKTPVIVIDDFNKENDSRIFNRVGVDHIISPGIGSEDLLNTISSLMSKIPGMSSQNTEPTQIEYSNNERCWQILMDEACGNSARFEERIWMYRSDMITLLGALKVHLTLLDYTQIEVNAGKLDNTLEQLQAQSWRRYLDEFRSLNQAQTGVERMRQLYRQMLDEYQKWDESLESFLLKIKNNPRG